MQSKIVSLSLLTAAFTIFNQNALADPYPLTQGVDCKNPSMLMLRVKTNIQPLGSNYCIPKTKANNIEESVRAQLKLDPSKSILIKTAGGNPDYMKYASTVTEPLQVIVK
jgi:hypothetical protein